MSVAVLPLSASASDTQRRAGDLISYALPAATFGVELWRGDHEGALQIAESLTATLVTTAALKHSIHAERPDHSDDQSFPSGHAAWSFAAATYVHRRHGLDSAWPLYALASYVGYTRVHARQHRWGDVAGGAAVAAASSGWLAKPLGPGASLELGRRSVSINWNVPLR
jgi:membrane-associated phospholipid phosphatase